jgi:hypothetical protein
MQLHIVYGTRRLLVFILRIRVESANDVYPSVNCERIAGPTWFFKKRVAEYSIRAEKETDRAVEG